MSGFLLILGLNSLNQAIMRLRPFYPKKGTITTEGRVRYTGIKTDRKQNYEIPHLPHTRLLPQPTTTPQNHQNPMTNKKYSLFSGFSASIHTYPYFTHLRRITRNQAQYPSPNLSHSPSHFYRASLNKESHRISLNFHSFRSVFQSPHPTRRTSPSRPAIPHRLTDYLVYEVLYTNRSIVVAPLLETL